MNKLIKGYERKIANIKSRIKASDSLFEKAYLYYELKTHEFALSEVKALVEL